MAGAERKRHRGRPVAAVIAVVALCLAACSTYVDKSPQIKQALTNEDYEDALLRIEELEGGGDQLLYFYEKGTVLHYQQDYVASNEAFAEAELLYEELYTKSLSREAASFITSDNIIEYRGQRYEAALSHYFKILNYCRLGDEQAAVIESRKIVELLTLYIDEGRPQDNDPFLRYLTALVFNAYGDRMDASVSFRQARESYELLADRYGVHVPADFYCDMAVNARSVFDLQTTRALVDSGLCDGSMWVPDSMGTVNVFLECGYAPYRIEEKIIIPIYKNEIRSGMDREEYAWTLYDRYGRPRNYNAKLDYLLKVAVPNLVVDPFSYPDLDGSVITGGVQYRGYAEVVADLEAQAFIAFEEDKPQIFFRTILRGLAKYIAQQQAKKEDDLAGALVNVFNIATERADTRSWVTLPQTIRMARLYLPEGTHDVEISVIGAGRTRSAVVIPSVTVRAGKTTFVNHRLY